MESIIPYTPTQDEKTKAMLAHLLQIFTGFLGPLVIYYFKRDSHFVKFHTIQALLLQGCMACLYILMVIVWFVFAVWIAVNGLVDSQASRTAPRAFVISIGVLAFAWIAAWLLNMVPGSYFTLKAANGRWAAYPIIGRWARRWAGVAPQQKTATTPNSGSQSPG